jgi:hypothetical protein
VERRGADHWTHWLLIRRIGRRRQISDCTLNCKRKLR